MQPQFSVDLRGSITQQTFDLYRDFADGFGKFTGESSWDRDARRRQESYTRQDLPSDYAVGQTMLGLASVGASIAGGPVGIAAGIGLGMTSSLWAMDEGDYGTAIGSALGVGFEAGGALVANRALLFSRTEAFAGAELSAWNVARYENPAFIQAQAQGAAQRAAAQAAESESGLVNLTDAEGKAHILDRHGPGRGMPGKSEFPSSWSDERVLHEASDIATDPAQTWSPPNSRGYVTTTKTVDGVEVKVVYDTVNKRIVTAFPTNVPRNP